MIDYGNYIEDQNPFKLAGPPEYFLRGLYEFDRSLVVVPSRQGFYYRLAQRRKPQLAAAVVNEALFKESDTQMLASYNLVPVTTIAASPNWGNPILFEELRRRAPWRQFKTTNDAIDAVEAQDAKEELDKRAKTDEHLTELGKDAWGLYNKKIGKRTHMWSPRPKSSAPSFELTKSLNKSAGIKVGSIFVS